MQFAPHGIPRFFDYSDSGRAMENACTAIIPEYAPFSCKLHSSREFFTKLFILHIVDLHRRVAVGMAGQFFLGRISYYSTHNDILLPKENYTVMFSTSYSLHCTSEIKF